MAGLLTITRHRIDLRLHHSVRLPFRHEVMLHSLFAEALGKGELPGWIVPFASESGRIDFERGDRYCIGLTIIGSDPGPERDAILRALNRYGSRGFQGDRIPMLRWFDIENIDVLPALDVETESERLRRASQLALHFISPLRMEIPRAEGHHGNTPRFFSASEFPAAAFLRFLRNRFFFLETGRHPNRAESTAAVPAAPPLHCDPSALLRVDVPRLKKAPIGGVCGKLVLENPGDAWLPLLVAGQWVHVGKSTGFGFGSYRIVHEDQPLWNDPFRPSQTLLSRVAYRDRLVAAAHRVASATEGGGIDGMRPAELERRAEELADDLARRLRAGTYAPAPLLGIVIPNTEGKVRALSVPTLVDRTVQRAVLEVLGPAVESLLEDASFGYRKGFSRAGAAKAIERAYAEGYRYVLDADIDSFFDAVDWPRLFAKLDALYPFDPLTAVLKGWISAPVVFQGQTIVRTRGLPQGAVISPTLANLFLDELDEELLRGGFRLVRYADDFVVLCRDAESAARAHEEARAALQRLGLSLQEEKTSIVSMDHGFMYLGYLFCRSVALDHRKDEAADVSTGHPIVARSSWLAGVDLSRIRALDPHAPVPSLPAVVTLHGKTTAAPPDGRRPLYVIDPAVFLRESN